MSLSKDLSLNKDRSLSKVRSAVVGSCCFVLVAACVANAGTTGVSDAAANEEALQKTQALLRNQGERQKAIHGDAKATEADQHVKNLVGPENSDAVYDLSADIMGNLVKEANGDPAKMQEILNKAMANPEAFANSFTPEQKAKLHSIGNTVERNNASTGSPR